MIFCFEAPKIDYEKLESQTESSPEEVKFEIVPENVPETVENKPVLAVDTIDKKDNMIAFKNEFFIARQTPIDNLNLDILKVNSLIVEKSIKTKRKNIFSQLLRKRLPRSISWPSEKEAVEEKNKSSLIKKDNTEIDLNNVNDVKLEKDPDALNKKKKNAKRLTRLFRRKPFVSSENLKSK